MPKKVIVEVNADFDVMGVILPKTIKWEDGRVFEIDRVLDIRPAASTKVGGCGIRYTCRILGKQTYLFLEENTWFVEGKD